MIASNKILALTLALVPFSAAVDNCLNSESFRVEIDSKQRSCKWIRFKEERRVALCPDPAVDAACKHTCGSCCEDVVGYTFTRQNGMEATCDWLAEAGKEVRKTKYCSDTKSAFNGRTVRDGCSKSCDFCFEKVIPATSSPAPSILSAAPSGSPTSAPSGSPTAAPTGKPSQTPTDVPTRPPSPMPSPFPTSRPTFVPSVSPSRKPSQVPSLLPTLKPSQSPSDLPSLKPSQGPSGKPSQVPSLPPSSIPSADPSLKPSAFPSLVPSSKPSVAPSDLPSLKPSLGPSSKPSQVPSLQPSNKPTASIKPSASPSKAPVSPTPIPSSSPSSAPSSTFVCENNSWTWTLVNEPKEVDCSWITKNNVAVRRSNYCGEDSIKMNCPQACGVCIADDASFTFKLKKLKTIQNCSWITKNTIKTELRKTAYCGRESIAAGCASTCA